MIDNRIKDLPTGDLTDLLSELELLKGLIVADHGDMSLYSYLVLCQRDRFHNKREVIQAANFYRGSLLRTRVEKLSQGDTLLLVKELCVRFHVPFELVVKKPLYVFLNDVLNPLSQLRKPAPIWI